jgi:hypothetical protein
LKENIEPFLAEIKSTCSPIHVQAHYFNNYFDQIYTDIKATLRAGRYGNVMFNLDQYGSSHVDLATIRDIFLTWKSAEAFLTFPIQTVRTFISTEKEKSSVLIQEEDLLKEIYAFTEKSILNKNDWLGGVERIVFDKLRECAPYASPFSIHNPDGWRYWLIHFANSHRARQVYNDVLHANSSSQAQFGRSGLRMLSFDPSHEGTLYLFDQCSREAAKSDLYDDIPRLVLDQGDAMSVMDFYTNVYNETPAHSDDIHEMMLANPDMEVLTPSGNPRRSTNTITPEDTLRVKMRKSFFPIFLSKEK